MTVHLVGAGPGDPDLLTVRAARLLSVAEVVVYDRLVTAAMLDLVPTEALLIDVGKAAGASPVTQQRINELLIEHGRTGRTVVRLKGGDPYVFGRGGEEAVALDAAGIPFDVVPGLSSALAAPAAVGIPVTMRNQSLSFTVVTGHEDPQAAGSVDWEALAATGSTLVILMGVGRIRTITQRLLAGGLSPATPVAVIHWATTARQQVLRTTLAEVSDEALSPPSTIVVGAVAGLDLRSRRRSTVR
ncbi:MAG: uroporphyrinogen-III C-methyltransferase [Acidimicrobiales bacterium]